MKTLALISALLFFSVSSSANEFANQFGFQGESSIPEAGAPTSALIPADKNNELPVLNVLVFPHTLKNDWLHGKPDDASQVELKSEHSIRFEVAGNYYRSTHFKLRMSGSRIKATLLDGRVIHFKKADIIADGPVKVHRILSPDKSHSYLGTFTVSVEDKGIKLINHVDIETYLRGVVPKESVASWPLDALKAQALAARSYAYYHYLTAPSGRAHHVDDTARFQVYAGHSGSDTRTDVAVEQTRGELMTYEGKVIVAYFHAYSGGRTDSALNIFKQDNVPYCAGNAEIFPRDELSDELASGSRWIVNWTTKAYSSAALLSEFKESSRVGSRFGDFNRSASVELEETEINDLFDSVKVMTVVQPETEKEAVLDFTEVRSALGWSNFPGYHFRVDNTDEGFVFKGSGWGHHVGLSQWGAFIMAKNYSKTYRDIVLHYYNDVEIQKMPWSQL
tara:strand:- start:2348 stop:3694 length:1347 start_codon:yes stop_codon:yes gene_type:complete